MTSEEIISKNDEVLEQYFYGIASEEYFDGKERGLFFDAKTNVIFVDFVSDRHSLVSDGNVHLIYTVKGEPSGRPVMRSWNDYNDWGFDTWIDDVQDNLDKLKSLGEPTLWKQKTWKQKTWKF